MPTFRLVSSSIAVLVALWLLMGCSRIERVHQCRSLVRTVNGAISEIQELRQVKKADPETYVKITERYQSLAKDLGPLEFQDETVAREVAEYASMFLKAATASKNVATALREKNTTLMQRSEREFEQISQTEKQLVRKLNGWCQKP